MHEAGYYMGDSPILQIILWIASVQILWDLIFKFPLLWELFIPVFCLLFGNKLPSHKKDTPLKLVVSIL